MPFSTIERAVIAKALAPMCRRRSPAALADKVRVIYEIEGNSVVLYEEHPDWDDGKTWERMPSAKLRFVRTRGTWTLYWMRRDLKWHVYDPEAADEEDLATLVRIVDIDEYGAFFG